MANSNATTATPTKFSYVEEQDSFLALFPHRYDFIFAQHPQPKCRPDWRTESRYPLSDRLLIEGAFLYGVRFGAATNYCLLDIDAGSYYHPQRDHFAISRILAALEPLGLSASVSCTSSYSGGIHLYLPFQQAQPSWKIAIVTSTLLQQAGFSLQPGQLEIFPNPKFCGSKIHSLFNAHRLPLQTGSYLLNQSFQPIWSDRNCFVQHWRSAQEHNDISIRTINRILKQTRSQPHHTSGKADKFIQDLNAEIESGWTGFGQTNRILGRIAMRSYIFHHILFGGNPLTGQALTNSIVETARSLPGYQLWCRHQHEIEKKAVEWARCVENSSYFPYGIRQGKFKAKAIQASNSSNSPTWNQQQTNAARERIKTAIGDLLEKDALPANTTARFRVLVTYGVSGRSLYRHRDLWHPECMSDLPDSLEENDRQDSTSLLPGSGGNALIDGRFSDSSKDSQTTGDNRRHAEASGESEADLLEDCSEGHIQNIVLGRYLVRSTICAVSLLAVDICDRLQCWVEAVDRVNDRLPFLRMQPDRLSAKWDLLQNLCRRKQQKYSKSCQNLELRLNPLVAEEFVRSYLGDQREDEAEK